jgi:hypothetical protein
MNSNENTEKIDNYFYVDKNILKTDKNIRKQIVEHVKKFLDIQIVSFNIILNKIDEEMYETIEKILIFLNEIDMELFSSLIFLGLCKYYKLNKNKIPISEFKKWLKTQSYIIKYVDYIPFIFPLDCENIVGLRWVGNSCYLDSVLTCLFAVPNKDIIDNILLKDLDTLKDEKFLDIKCSDDIDIDIKYKKDIQTSLNDIVISMRGFKYVKNCSQLRKMLSKCPVSQKFHRTGTQDAGEFLQYIFGLFNVNIANSITKTYGSNNKIDWTQTSELEYITRPIISITPLLLKEMKDNNSIYNITHSIKTIEITEFDNDNLFKPKIDGITYEYTFKKQEIFMEKESPFIIFYLNRLYSGLIFNKNKNKRLKTLENTSQIINVKIEAPEKFENFELFGIVIHKNNHYTCTFKCKKDWFYYDDTSLPIQQIGSYKKMLKIKPNPLKRGTLYFYKKL